MSNGTIKKSPALGFVDGVNVLNGIVEKIEDTEGQRLLVTIKPEADPKWDKPEHIVAMLTQQNLQKLKVTRKELEEKKVRVNIEIHPMEVIIRSVDK
jgi:hypothetical protein